MIRDAIIDIRRILLDSKYELRAGQHPLQRRFDARVKTSFAAPGLIEVHEGLQILIGDGLAVGAAGDSIKNPLCTGGFLRRAYWPADKHSAAAGRISGSACLKRARYRKGL